MPIYPYRCNACGFRKDVLQKMSDPALSVCPSCGAESFAKQLSAPAFQLKGTGWYATDFRDNGKKPAPAESGAAAAAGDAGAAIGVDAGGDKNAAAKSSDGKGSEAKGSEAKGSDAKGDSKSNGTSDKTGGAAPAVSPVVKPAATGGGSTGTAGTSGGGSGAS